MEHQYGLFCLEEQDQVKELERRVFKIMQGIPPALEELYTPAMNECNNILKEMEGKIKLFDPLKDWEEFEARHQREFCVEPIKPIVVFDENHPDEEEYEQYQRIQLDSLEIYHKLQNPYNEENDKNFSGKLKRAMSLSKHDYALRGSWSISAAGYLIEFDFKNHCCKSIFNLRKCKVGAIVYEELKPFAKFTLT